MSKIAFAILICTFTAAAADYPGRTWEIIRARGGMKRC
jgi:hypothetical protein